jgi:hypothetical protein
MHRRAAWRLVVALLAVTACARRAKDADQPVPQCTAPTTRLQQGATLASLSGSYTLGLVATSGAHSGRTVNGELRIDAPRGLASTTAGTSTIALDSVGAFAAGTAKGPTYGVTALAWSSTSGGVASPEITVRYGSLASPEGTQAIEGSYTALSVRKISPEGFGGTWESGEGGKPGPAGGGYFCAVRLK